MKRVTLRFDDEGLYREVKAEAAREGRAVKEIVAEALSDWQRRRTGLSSAERERWKALLQQADELRRRQQAQDNESIEDALWAIRNERP